jgi:hypothetical protein
MRAWLEDNEPVLRTAFRLVMVGIALFALNLLQGLHDFRGGPDISGVAADVASMQKDVQKLRDKLDPPATIPSTLPSPPAPADPVGPYLRPQP